MKRKEDNQQGVDEAEIAKVKEYINGLKSSSLDDSNVFTKLIDKHYSPLIIRKYTHWGFPIYIGLITDNNVKYLDFFIESFMETFKKDYWVNDLQMIRNFAGFLTESLNDFYPKTEGVAVTFYVDKCFVSSLHGDFMNHESCRIEYQGLLTMSTGV